MWRGALAILAIIGALVLVIALAIGAGVYRAARLQAASDAPVAAPSTTPTSRPATQPAVLQAVLAATQEVKKAEEGPLLLLAKDAVIHGFLLQIKGEMPKFLTGWTDLRDSVEWPVDIARGGFYQVDVEYACDPSKGGGVVTFQAGRTRSPFAIVPTNGWDDYRTLNATRMYLPPGAGTLVVRPTYLSPDRALLNLRSVKLTLIREIDEPEVPRFRRRGF